MFSANCLLIIKAWNRNIKNHCIGSKLSTAYIGVFFLRVANNKYLCKTIWRGTANFPSCRCLCVRDIPSQRYYFEFLIHMTYSNSKHRYCTATRKSATQLSSSPSLFLVGYLLVAHVLHVVYIWLFLLSAHQWFWHHLTLQQLGVSAIVFLYPWPTREKKSSSVMGVNARQFKTYCTWHTHSFLCNDVIVLA